MVSTSCQIGLNIFRTHIVCVVSCAAPVYTSLTHGNDRFTVMCPVAFGNSVLLCIRELFPSLLSRMKKNAGHKVAHICCMHVILDMTMMVTIKVVVMVTVMLMISGCHGRLTGCRPSVDQALTRCRPVRWPDHVKNRKRWANPTPCLVIRLVYNLVYTSSPIGQHMSSMQVVSIPPYTIMSYWM